MQKSAKLAFIAVIVVVLGGGVGFWYFVLKDDSAPKAQLDLGTTTGSNPGGSLPSSPDGTWTVKANTADAAIFAGYRIEEVFGGDTIKKSATGRTSKVTGSMTIAGTTISAADFTVDMTTISSDRAPRDGFMRTNGLETDTFKTSTFKLTAPVTLPAAPEVGKELDITAQGELTMHGQTKPVTVTMKAGWTGDEIRAVGEATVTLADFGITQLSLGPATIEPTGLVEFSLNFTK